MNVITNTCLGGGIYRDILKQPFANPFIWADMTGASYNSLFMNFFDMDFRNFRIERRFSVERQLHRYYIILERNVEVKFEHVIYDRTALKPTVKGSSVRTKYPRILIQQNWQRRLCRMTEPPVFLFSDMRGYRNYELSSIAEAIKRPVGIFTIDKNFPSNEFAKVVFVDPHDLENTKWLECLTHKYRPEIEKFLRQS